MRDGAIPPSSPPYRMPVPPVAAHVALPEGFGTRFFITVDTEEEFDWSAPFTRDSRSVEAMAALPAAAARLSGMGASITTLIDHPVATDPSAVDRLSRCVSDHGTAVGAQLHPWVNPPFDEDVTRTNSFLGNLPTALADRKIAALTTTITSAFGAPRIFRAGRYGLGPATLGLLSRHGYRIDSSVRAYHDYSAEGGPDYSAVSVSPFRSDDPHGDIVEVPLTAVFTGRLRRNGATLYPLATRWPGAGGLLARTGLLARVSLTPEGMPASDVLEAIRLALDSGTRLLVFSFHSPSLVPGHTPYVRDAGDLAAFWAWWNDVLRELARRGVRNIDLEELIAALA